MSNLELRAARLTLRTPRAEDGEPLLKVLSEDGVRSWWPNFDRARVETELLHPDPDLTVLAIEVGGEVAGAIQFSEETDPEFFHASIDLFLGARFWGQGIGPEAINALVEFLVNERGHHRIVIDPAAANARAIRAYEKCGFRKVGLMREYQKGLDGTWGDGMLMELLASERTR
jgi:aminoglycoside 6'-N-acetyltransferase